MTLYVEQTKTEAGRRVIPITEEVAECFRAIIEDRPAPKCEKMIDGYTGFLFWDKNDNPLVAMHWQHHMKSMVNKYNDIYRVQMPSITPHVCRHTYCSNMAKSGMNWKMQQMNLKRWKQSRTQGRKWKGKRKSLLRRKCSGRCKAET